MKILKSHFFSNHTELTLFVNDNAIVKEDILAINSSGNSLYDCTIFFYADSEVEEKTRNIWGKLKS